MDHEPIKYSDDVEEGEVIVTKKKPINLCVNNSWTCGVVKNFRLLQNVFKFDYFYLAV